MSFLIMILIWFQYLVYAIAYGGKNYVKLLSWLEKKLKAGMILGTILTLIVETYFDFAVGSQLRFEQPEFKTGSDYFDFVFATLGAAMVLGFPLFCFLFLKKNVNILDQEEFKSKYGALYNGYATYNSTKRDDCIKMSGWFLFRRLLTAVNLV
jgi:hypothetical protein